MNVLLIPLIFLFIYCDNSSSPNKLVEPGPNIEVDSSIVAEFFKQQYDKFLIDSSEHHLDTIFNFWEKSYRSNEKRVNLSSDDKEALLIFKAAYKPLGFPKQVGSEWGDLYAQADYLVVSCNFEYLITSGSVHEPDFPDYDTLSVGYINGIRPELSFQKPHVYLTGDFQDGINGFLGFQYNSGRESPPITPAISDDEIKNRASFLGKKIKIMNYHWSYGYHFQSHPDIREIYINEERNKARIYFSIIYQGGYMSAEKRNGIWEITEAKLTWITKRTVRNQM